jgi:hypothetical protein
MEFLEFFYFSSTERNPELFSLPLKGSEGNSEILLLFLFHGTEFRVVFSSAEGVRKGIMRVYFFFLVLGTEFRVVFSSTEGFGTEFREFLFRGTAGIPSEITICSVCSVFRGIIFLSVIPNPNLDLVAILPILANVLYTIQFSKTEIFMPGGAYYSMFCAAEAIFCCPTENSHHLKS